MRNITDIIEQIKAEIPDEYPSKTTIEFELDRILNTYRYFAPEAKSFFFKELIFVLGTWLSLADKDWKQKIQRIMSGD